MEPELNEKSKSPESPKPGLSTIRSHLSSSRKLQIDRYSVSVDEDERVAYFYIWNLSGQLVGYQHYRPDADKQAKNSPRSGRYYTYVSKEGDRGHRLAVWGLESLTYRDDVVFVLEGIFKCVPFHNRNIPAIATLTNNPKPLRNFLNILSKGRRLIFIGDNDTNGSTTRSMGYEFHLPPSHVKDADELSDNEFDTWIKGILND